VVANVYNPSRERLGQEEHEFEASLGNTTKPSVSKIKNKTKQQK
jgi:hypothetical protein